MKKLIAITVLILMSFLYSEPVLAQYARGHRVHHKHVRKAQFKSRHRPAGVRVFYPKWHPKRAYHRRWVYFPKYNIYYDNWRGHYVYRNGNVWASQTVPPPILINVNLANVPHRELSEQEDEYDDVYMDNLYHQDLEEK